MDIIETLDRAACFIIDPSNHKHSTVEKSIAWSITIVTAILSIGTVQIGFVLWRHLRQINENDTHRKISELFNNIFGSGETKQKSDGPPNIASIGILDNSGNPPSTSASSSYPPSEIPTPSETPEPLTLNVKQEPIPAVITQVSSSENILSSNEICITTIEKIKKISYSSKIFDEHLKAKLGNDVTLIETEGNEPNSIEKRLNESAKKGVKFTFFKFNPNKWEKVLEDLTSALEKNLMVTNANDLVKQCELDLIEALAEYNVEEPYILNNRKDYDNKIEAYTKSLILPGEGIKGYEAKINEFKMQNRFLNTLFTDTQVNSFVDPIAAEIINKAKQTCKVSLQINHYLNLEENSDSFKFAPNPTHSPVGPYYQIIFSGCECQQGYLPVYRNPQKWGIVMNLDLVIGKRQGERLFIQTKGEQYIIRLDQQYDRNRNTFEQKLINGIMFGESHRAEEISKLKKKMRKEKNQQALDELITKKYELVNKNKDRRKQIFQKLEDAYGKKRIDQEIKKWEIKDPRDTIS